MIPIPMLNYTYTIPMPYYTIPMLCYVHVYIHIYIHI